MNETKPRFMLFLPLQNNSTSGRKPDERKCSGHHLGAVRYGATPGNECIGKHARRRQTSQVSISHFQESFKNPVVQKRVASMSFRLLVQMPSD